MDLLSERGVIRGVRVCNDPTLSHLLHLPKPLEDVVQIPLYSAVARIRVFPYLVRKPQIGHFIPPI